jgi:hypothetical protein
MATLRNFKYKLQYNQHFMDKRYSPNNQKKKRCILKTFFKYLQREQQQKIWKVYNSIKICLPSNTQYYIILYSSGLHSKTIPFLLAFHPLLINECFISILFFLVFHENIHFPQFYSTYLAIYSK